MPSSSTGVKAALRIPVAVTYYDTRIASCVSAANSYVLNRIRQSSLAVSTQTEYAQVHGAGQRMIVLRRRPVVGIAVITNDGAVLSASSYRVDLDAGLLYRTGNSYWSDEPDGVQVHYGAGYDATTIPDELVEAATEIAVSMFNRAPLAGLDQQDDGAMVVRVSQDAIPATARAVLRKYADITP